MILALDVHYFKDHARAAAVGFNDWQASEPTQEFITTVKNVAAYESGAFYKRELPIILSLLKEHKLTPQTLVIDGYVYLDGIARAGLGKFLFDALDSKVGVIGVAKNPFEGIDEAFAVRRGGSKRPLYVTSVGFNNELAKQYVKTIHGEHRLPTLLKLVDQLARDNSQG